MTSGGYVHIVNMARNLGEDVTFFGPETIEADFLNAVPGARFVVMPDFPWLPGRLKVFFRGIFGFTRRAELREMDAILTVSHFIGDTLPAFYARPNRTVVMVHHFIAKPWERGGGGAWGWAGWISQMLSLVFVRRCAARFVFVSSHVMQEGQQAGIIAGRPAFVTANGVDPPDDFRPAPFERRTGGVFLGRLHPIKRVDDAIRAWSRIPRELAGPLTIVGPNEVPAYCASLRQLAADLGVSDRVQFAGEVSDDEKWRLLSGASVFVFPSAEEGWGVAIAEAMAAALPCVTYDLPVYRDIFTRGRVAVPLGDVDALTAACTKLLSDAIQRGRLSEEAADLAKSFTWPAIAKVLRESVLF